MNFDSFCWCKIKIAIVTLETRGIIDNNMPNFHTSSFGKFINQ